VLWGTCPTATRFVSRSKNGMRPLLAALIALLVAASAAAAQQGKASESSGQEELPFSVARIKDKLGDAPASKLDGLRLDFHVEVLGTAPKIELFENFDLKSSAVQYGGMTHGEFLNLVTPREFRSPTIDFLSLGMMLAQALGGRAYQGLGDWRLDRVREEVRRDIADYEAARLKWLREQQERR
jgi:hypothetical protein